LKTFLQYSKNGLSLTENFEGFRSVAYWDADGQVWTIGYGHTGNVRPGDQVTRAQAEAFLLSDVQVAVKAVNRLVAVQLTQDEFDSCVDFCFNLGQGTLQHSTMLTLLNAGKFTEAADEFDKWDHAGGKVVAGLLRRREEETQLFSNGEQLNSEGVQV
jgi:lysozyme